MTAIVVPLHSGRVRSWRVLSLEELHQTEVVIARMARADALGQDATNRGVTWELDNAANVAAVKALSYVANVQAEDVNPPQYDSIYWTYVSAFADARREMTQMRLT